MQLNSALSNTNPHGRLTRVPWKQRYKAACATDQLLNETSPGLVFGACLSAQSTAALCLGLTRSLSPVSHVVTTAN